MQPFVLVWFSFNISEYILSPQYFFLAFFKFFWFLIGYNYLYFCFLVFLQVVFDHDGGIWILLTSFVLDFLNDIYTCTVLKCYTFYHYLALKCFIHLKFWFSSGVWSRNIATVFIRFNSPALLLGVSFDFACWCWCCF